MTNDLYSLHQEGWGLQVLADQVNEADIIKSISSIADDLIGRKGAAILDDNYVLILPSGEKCIDYNILIWLKDKIEDDKVFESVEAAFEESLLAAIIESYGCTYDYNNHR